MLVSDSEGQNQCCDMNGLAWTKGIHEVMCNSLGADTCEEDFMELGIKLKIIFGSHFNFNS